MVTNLRSNLIVLVCSLLSALLLPLFWSVQLIYVGAPIVMLFYNSSLSLCLWISLVSGCLLDSLVHSPRFGFLGLTFLLTARILYPWHLYFFKDSKVTLPAMTYLFSLIAHLVELVIALFFDLSLPRTSIADFFLLPFLDVGFLMSVFVLPSFLWQLYRLSRHRRRYSDDS